MKKLLRYLLMTVMALCFSLPCFSAEAATVALLPLINNVQGDEVATQVFYKEVINAMNAQKGFMMVENNKVTTAINDANVGNNLPNKLVLAKIAQDGNVDIVIAMQLDKIEDENYFDLIDLLAAETKQTLELNEDFPWVRMREAFEERKRLITEGLARDEFFNQAYKMSKKLHYNLPESTQDSQEKYYY